MLSCYTLQSWFFPFSHSQNVCAFPVSDLTGVPCRPGYVFVLSHMSFNLPKMGNQCSQEKHPLPCLKPLDICSVLVSPQASLPFITLLLFFFSFKIYLGNKLFQQTLCPHLFNFSHFCSLSLLSYFFSGRSHIAEPSLKLATCLNLILNSWSFPKLGIQVCLTVPGLSL